jgi:hypothetical protein
MEHNSKAIMETETNVELSTNPLDMEPEQFNAGLDRRKQNRGALMDWVKSSLVVDVDFGSIMIGGRKSRPSLLKPGAEKICGMLGMTPTFPNLPEYEAVVLGGGEINQIILRCELVSGKGQVVAEGVGARSVKQDSGDLNKSLKMCLKSAQIDATLRCAGLSEVFTQDIEDMDFGNNGSAPEDSGTFVAEFDRTQPVGFGKKCPDTPWMEAEEGFVQWVASNMDGKYKDFAEQELEARAKESVAKTESEETGVTLKPASTGKEEVTGDVITPEQTAEFQRIIEAGYESGAISGDAKEKAYAWLKTSPSKQRAESQIKIAKKMVGDSKPPADVESLIDAGMKAWGCDKARSVELLNTNLLGLFEAKTIDQLSPKEISQYIQMVIEDKILPF